MFGNSTEGLKPGDSGYITWTLTNTGDIAGDVTLSATVTGADNDVVPPELAILPTPDDATAGELQDYIGVILTCRTYDDEDDLISEEFIYGDSGEYWTLSGLNTFAFPAAGNYLASNGIEYIEYTLDWQIAADIWDAVNIVFGDGDDTDANDNIIMTDSAVLDITFILTQWDAPPPT